jgi:hypothetical protein
MVEIIEESFRKVFEEIVRHDDGQSEKARNSTHEDDILGELERTLEGRIGAALDPTAYQDAVKEGLRRIEQQIPPGYKDKSKTQGERAAGDYIVWLQLLHEAKARKCDVLFVTNDLKEDWWRIEPGDLRRGPRPELCTEMRDFAEVGLYLLRPGSLLEHASRALQVDIQEQSVKDVNRVDEILSQQEEEVSTDGGWTTSGLAMVLSALHEEAPVQAAAIGQAAVEGNGHISRADVYKIGNYSQDRKLIGFTRPISRITDEMRDFGYVNSNAVNLVDTDYGSDSPAFGWASGFHINPTVLPLFSTLPSGLLEKIRIRPTSED